MKQIHHEALEVATQYLRCEKQLVLIIQKVDEDKSYRDLELKNLTQYCIKFLNLSESVTFNFTAVSRKAAKLPELQSAIQSGLSISVARKITSVVNFENQAEWVEKAQTLSCRKLEKEVARANPKETTPERMKYVTGDRLELKMGISEVIQEKLKRVQDLESQRTAHAASLEESLEAALDLYLEKKDPVKKAERAKLTDLPVTGQVTGPIPAQVRHQVNKRDKGQCTFIEEGKRCESRRWIDLHHIKPRSHGGTNSVENLTTLCKAHHRAEHDSIS